MDSGPVPHPPGPLRTESPPWLRWDLWFPESQGLLLTAGQGLVPPYHFPLRWDTFSLFLDLVPEEPEKKPWADSQEARPGPSLGWLACLESLESESGELILSLSLAKQRRVTSTEVWLPAPLRGQSCEVAMPGAPPHLQKENQIYRWAPGPGRRQTQAHPAMVPGDQALRPDKWSGMSPVATVPLPGPECFASLLRPN